jgi:hypothetical protein
VIATPNIAVLTATVYSRLKTDTEGASVRAAVGVGASSVIHAGDLDAATLPPRPFVALRRGPCTPVNLSEWRAYFTWWLYDSPEQGYYRLDSLIRLVGQAYAAKDLSAPVDGAPSWIELSAGQQGQDAKLNSLLFVPLTLVISF